jgi:intron-binding protein aquarius
LVNVTVEAILSGSLPGLTLIVGPPGTGKTDVAVQILANLYHNYPNQHTLLITHSNQALNQLFEKISKLDIDPRHLLRLGHGMDDLDLEGDWSKSGRVQSFLEKRLVLLQEVDRLAYSLGVAGAHGSTCETASYFFSYFVEGRIGNYGAALKGDSVEGIISKFPFYVFFSNAPQPLFKSKVTLAEAKEIAEGCLRYIENVFSELEEIRAFELLRTNQDRNNYLLLKEARIIALTCTHAALKRKELVSLGFKYDNVVMEEAGQILEVETFIPLLLQSPDAATGTSRLKRVVMLGDHNQLPPVVKNGAFKKYANLDQSMFSRLIRLGVPAVHLDMQGRCRPGISDLFKWRYNSLGDLDVVLNEKRFGVSNPGFCFDYQFINVEDYNKKGETEPIPFFYQNLGEAEYVVATYQYMRLLGYVYICCI